MKSLGMLLFILILSACAANGPAYTRAPAAQADQALVYIYRIDSFMLGGRDAYFYIDDVNVADLSRNGYTWFHVPAGKHVLKQKWPFDVAMFRKLEIPVNWQAGQTYYYRFVAYGGGNNPPRTMTFNWELAGVGEHEALREIQETKLQPAFAPAK